MNKHSSSGHARSTAHTNCFFSLCFYFHRMDVILVKVWLMKMEIGLAESISTGVFDLMFCVDTCIACALRPHSIHSSLYFPFCVSGRAEYYIDAIFPTISAE